MARLLDPQDLSTYTQLRLGAINQKVHFGFHQSWETLKSFLDEVFEAIEDLPPSVEESAVEGEEGKHKTSCLVDRVSAGLLIPLLLLNRAAATITVTPLLLVYYHNHDFN